MKRTVAKKSPHDRNVQSIINHICIQVFTITDYSKDVEDKVMAMGFTVDEKKEALEILKKVFKRDK